ncbi:phospho-N-acetylmuramoyl-pentapeptide-transferase [Gammaproteobacteria bacterium]|nr:phospho-N-acetylmuramoyl-pentapeptide-transferase [bacterium]MDA9974122.1 phospho-N-acetylmuramoyl-pentapeptide-transferase [Gammaproteobacteria bacterium]MDB9790699.1 phospho-N-acetylmuramoyl-pentapeptide-transferase [Gammaproteobacteria bacterium]MDC1475470.1 phospho-N-acetylmuramoyl-pentapeptide-transferase [Gammaproteobacteria bacterium]|tara:strand:+ start:7214 stop:8299 length:1086 start_codon:yes stop_codon:yes gene_type:complete
MIELIGTWLMAFDPGFDVLRYLTVRTIGSTLTALILSIVLGPIFIKYLTHMQFSQSIRSDGPQSHLAKSGTPTMGGLIIIFSFVASTLLWSDFQNPYIWVLLFITLTFASIGFLDDWFKIREKNSKGLSGRYKLCLQFVFSLMAVMLILRVSPEGSKQIFLLPFSKDFIFTISPILFVGIGIFVIMGASNAVNLTDGLDGLAILPTILIAGGLGLIAYAMGNQIIANYLFIPFHPFTGELIVFCGALVGAGIGFLWYNAYPAEIFMGDLGSLTLGGILGTLAVLLRHEVVFAIMAGVFVMETLSVIIQVGSFKITGKRVFLMAPIHHHFELKGWAEPKVIVRFWIITFVLVLFALATLKLR